MADRTTTLLKRACQRTGVGEASVSDRELLPQFADAGDHDAFAVVAARHAAMVIGVCRRYLACVHDAEDACQATFLILARRAAKTRWQPSIANWLHTTARRVASGLRRTTDRRRRRENPLSTREPASVLDEITGRELLSLIDEELKNLAAAHREAVVLCCLEGLSREDAAERIGVPPATLKIRLERGRRRLEAALARRGVALGVVLLAVGKTDGSMPHLLKKIQSTGTGKTSPAVEALAQEIPMAALRNSLIATFVALGFVVGFQLVSSGAAKEERPAPGTVTTSGASEPGLPQGKPAEATESALKPADKFEEVVAAARRKAIQFLKDKQTPAGTWEGATALTDMDGGTTGLVALSLLEAGVPATDPLVSKSVDFLASLPPKKTYVVSLQTQVLARVDVKKHAERIQKNADWLLDQAIGWRKGGKLEGWSYPGNTMGDGSNTHFAVMGLHAAAGANAKLDGKIWEAIRDYYVRTRKPGGWAYHDAPAGVAPATESMTSAALVGLILVKKHDKATDASREATEKGWQAFLGYPAHNGKSTGYQGLVSAELGRLVEANEFKSGDKVQKWYRDGAERLLKSQQADGSWVGTGIDSSALLYTAFNLYLLGPGEK